MLSLVLHRKPHPRAGSKVSIRPSGKQAACPPTTFQCPPPGGLTAQGASGRRRQVEALPCLGYQQRPPPPRPPSPGTPAHVLTRPVHQHTAPASQARTVPPTLCPGGLQQPDDSHLPALLSLKLTVTQRNLCSELLMLHFIRVTEEQTNDGTKYEWNPIAPNTRDSGDTVTWARLPDSTCGPSRSEPRGLLLCTQPPTIFIIVHDGSLRPSVFSDTAPDCDETVVSDRSSSWYLRTGQVAGRVGKRGALRELWPVADTGCHLPGVGLGQVVSGGHPSSLTAGSLLPLAVPYTPKTLDCDAEQTFPEG